MTSVHDLLADAASRGAGYLDGLSQRRVMPGEATIAGLAAFGHPLQAPPVDPSQVLAELDAYGSPATVATAGGRYFGLVVGGSLPATVAARVLSAAWDQNAVLESTSPTAVALEKVATSWIVDLLQLPATTDVGFPSGASSANLAGLAAARHAVLATVGWNVEERGLHGAPPITVVVGDEVHATVPRALGLLGIGKACLVRVPTDSQGRMRVDALPPIDGPTIVCAQAGNVNTGAFDPLDAIADWCEAPGAWLHVDAAFGLWAGASPLYRHLTRGIGRADSIASDAHKWLNVPYDCGLVLAREPRHLHAAMAMEAAYLSEGSGTEPLLKGPEMSRRARGVEVWAALRSLGKEGVAELVDGCCRRARRLADGLRAAGYDVLNDVVLNQVLVSFGEPALTQRIIAAIQEEGSCWCGGTVWQGHTAMRISVSSWATTDEDVEISLRAILSVARRLTV